MSRPTRLDYAYAVGRVRALENYLIPGAIFREAAEAQDFRAALKLVYDAGAYPEDLIKVDTSSELDALLGREEEKLKCLLGEILLEKDLLEAMLLDERAPDKALSPAQKAGYPFIIDYYRLRIDLANIKIFCRAKYLEFAAKKLENYLIPGGSIAPQTLLEHYRLPLAEVCARVRPTVYCDLWTRAADVLEKQETFVELERGIEDFLMAYLRRAKYITFGPEPVFSYGLAKKKEIHLVRLLGLGKMLQIPVELIKERISATYV